MHDGNERAAKLYREQNGIAERDGQKEVFWCAFLHCLIFLKKLTTPNPYSHVHSNAHEMVWMEMTIVST